MKPSTLFLRYNIFDSNDKPVSEQPLAYNKAKKLYNDETKAGRQVTLRSVSRNIDITAHEGDVLAACLREEIGRLETSIAQNRTQALAPGLQSELEVLTDIHDRIDRVIAELTGRDPRPCRPADNIITK